MRGRGGEGKEGNRKRGGKRWEVASS